MFKCYRQLEHSDCGLTCIRMIARHFGNKIPLRELQKRSDLNRLGMSIKDITDCCSQINMDSYAIKVGESHIGHMPLPAILYWQQHFVVLYKINSRGTKFYIADPAQGKITYSKGDFYKYWFPEGDNKGIAILIGPTNEFRNDKYEEDNVFLQFFSYINAFITKHKNKFIMTAIITILIMATDFSIPLLLRRTIDEGIGLKDVGIVISLLMCQLFIAIGGLVSTSSIDIILTKIGLAVNIEMVNSFLEKLARFPLSFFDRKVSSDFVQKVNDQSRIKDFLLSFPNTIFISILEIGWNLFFLNNRKSLDFAFFTDSSANRNHAFELTNGMADLKVNNAEKVRIDKWKETQKRLNDISMKSTWLNIFQGGGQSIISRLKELIITGISANMVINGDMTFGIMMTLGYITGRLSEPISTLSSAIGSLQEAMLSYQRINEVIHDETEFRGNLDFIDTSIVFKNVWFKYAGSSSPYVIQEVNLTIDRGMVIALAGESGCGKSTLIKLMLGFYIPQKGEIFMGGHLVNEIDNSNWLRHCGAVMQDGKIFTGSILENISLSESNPDEHKAMAILSVVYLQKFVKSLPMGIHTRIGTSGVELSGGQKQRLMIARALYKNPDILFLDEATSSLDANNEHLIVDNIRKFNQGKTIIIAAHRLSTIRNADKILYMKNGKITEIGNHNELIRMKGDYWRLAKAQL